jgi:AAHS family 4-hydroxybenzoate transporter-like MFS transporter
VLFLIGGLVPLVVAICLLFTLPESIKVLAMQPHRRPELLRIARRLRPDLTFADDDRFETAAVIRHNAGPFEIFSGGLSAITPFLWLCFSMVLMSNYFLNSWMPLLFEDTGLSVKDAALSSSLYHVGGTIGGLLISVLLDRFGFIVIAALLAIAVPAIAAMGTHGISVIALAFFSTVAGFGVLGGQFGSNASAGLLYPTAIRSSGVGWAFAMGRIGAIVGPYIGAVLIGRHVPMRNLFLAASAPMAIGAVAALVLARLCYRRYGGLTLDDTPIAAPEPQGVTPHVASGVQ